MILVSAADSKHQEPAHSPSYICQDIFLFPVPWLKTQSLPIKTFLFCNLQQHSILPQPCAVGCRMANFCMSNLSIHLHLKVSTYLYVWQQHECHDTTGLCKEPASHWGTGSLYEPTVRFLPLLWNWSFIFFVPAQLKKFSLLLLSDGYMAKTGFMGERT